MASEKPEAHFLVGRRIVDVFRLTTDGGKGQGPPVLVLDDGTRLFPSADA